MIVPTAQEDQLRIQRNIAEANRIKALQRNKAELRKMRQRQEAAMREKRDQENHWTDPMRQALDFAGLT